MIIDLHTDYTLKLYKEGSIFGTTDQIDFDMLKTQSIKVFGCGFSYDDYHNHTEMQQLALEKELAKNNELELIKSIDDLESILLSSNKIGMLMQLEGASLIKSIDDLETYYQRGVRVITLSHGELNALAPGNKSASDEPLTALGKEVIKSANERGMIIDVSHTNLQSFYQIADLYNKPLVATHSNSRELCDDARNLDDEQIKTIAKSGGIVSIFFSSPFVNKLVEKVTIDNVVDHFKYISELVGVEYISLGSDFGGITKGVPVNLESVNQYPNLFIKLQESGFNKEEIEQIKYKNALRVLRESLI